MHAMHKLFFDSAQSVTSQYVLFKKEETNSVSHLVEINHLLHANSFGSYGSTGWKREPGSPPPLPPVKQPRPARALRGRRARNARPSFCYKIAKK